jgi:hypothetical protein
VAHAQSSNPACQRLEAQLATLDRGNADPARVEQIRRIEDTVNRQQFEVDRLVAQSRRVGCENFGLFSIFSNMPPQCGGLNRQIDQQRSALERMRNDLERLNGGTTERAAQRRGILIALGDNGCGAQYRSAALAGQQGGFWDRLFGDNGGGSVVSTPLGPMGGPSAPCAYEPVMVSISRFPTRRRPIASAMTSKAASACVRRPKFRYTPITIQARK